MAKLSISRNKKHPNLPADAQKIKGTLFSKYNFIHRFDESEGDGKKILSVVYIKTFHAAGATAAAATDAVVSKAIKEFGPCKKTELRKDDLGNMLEKDFGQTDFPILSIARISDTLVKVRLSSLSKMEFKEDDWDKVYKTLEKKFKTICSKVDEAATM